MTPAFSKAKEKFGLHGPDTIGIVSPPRIPEPAIVIRPTTTSVFNRYKLPKKDTTAAVVHIRKSSQAYQTEVAVPTSQPVTSFRPMNRPLVGNRANTSFTMKR